MESKSQISFWEPLSIFSGLGAVTWAIRGTDGWGGFDGAILPGMIWALLMYTYFKIHNQNLGGACFLFGLGIAIGGMWGYGVYISFINNQFLITETEFVPINPAIGYLWLFITGFAWGAPAAILFCWNVWRVKLRQWLIRITIPIIVCSIFFIIKLFAPEILYPYYRTPIYDDPNCISCARSLETNTVNALVFFWLIGAIISEFIIGHRKAAFLILFLGVSFGLAFTLSASWCNLYTISSFTDWWKMWELTMGFLGGIFVYVFMQFFSKTTDSITSKMEQNYPFPVHLSIFLYFLVLIYGFTSRLGVFLTLYPENFVQYDVPPQRLALILLLLVPFGLLFLRTIHRGPIKLNERFWVHTAFFTSFVGIATIWPSNLVVLYFILFWFSIAPLILKLPDNI